MFSLGVWLLGISLEGLLIVRALQGGFLRSYILFYSYVGWVFALSSTRLIVYLAVPGFYRTFYWHTQPVSVLVGCGVLWEIYRQALRRYPGASRMARSLLFFSLALVFSKILVDARNGPGWWREASSAELERGMRSVQALLLIALVLVLAHYAVPLGRNLKGMILGYGFFLSTSMIDLSLRLSLGQSFQKTWRYLQPACYLAALAVWCLTLWSYQPAPLPQTEPPIEEDYLLLAAKSRRRLSWIRTSLRRAIRR
jgi:hypothetical protein